MGMQNQKTIVVQNHRRRRRYKWDKLDKKSEHLITASEKTLISNETSLIRLDMNIFRRQKKAVKWVSDRHEAEARETIRNDTKLGKTR